VACGAITTTVISIATLEAPDRAELVDPLGTIRLSREVRPGSGRKGKEPRTRIVKELKAMDPEGANESEPQASERPEGGPERKRELPPAVHGPMAPPPPSARWPERLLTAWQWFYEWLSRPRVRLTVTGVILLLIGGLVMASSVWTLPLVIVGALMVVIAWIGSRLDGRFAVEWGEAGTQLEFRAMIRSAQPALPALPRTSVSSRTPARPPESAHPQVIDGEAHTVEIDVAELEALIAAVETTKTESAPDDAPGPATHTFRVARGGGRSSDARR
jgi:hypothetical protein